METTEMKHRLLPLAVIASVAACRVAFADQGQTTAQVVAACGTPIGTYAAGNIKPLTQTPAGLLCFSGTFTGSVTANSTAVAASAPPSLSPGAQPLSQTLGGGLRVQLNLAGTDIGLGQKTSANSVPVVLPSDQTVPVSGAVTISGTIPTKSQPQTPAAGTASAIITGGSAVTLVTGAVNGCFVTNPTTASDQNIAVAEIAYVNPVTTATANGRGTNVSLAPGQTFTCPGGMTTNLSAIAATSSHAFSVVVW